MMEEGKGIVALIGKRRYSSRFGGGEMVGVSEGKKMTYSRLGGCGRKSE